MKISAKATTNELVILADSDNFGRREFVVRNMDESYAAKIASAINAVGVPTSIEVPTTETSNEKE